MVVGALSWSPFLFFFFQAGIEIHFLSSNLGLSKQVEGVVKLGQVKLVFSSLSEALGKRLLGREFSFLAQTEKVIRAAGELVEVQASLVCKRIVSSSLSNCINHRFLSLFKNKI